MNITLESSTHHNIIIILLLKSFSSNRAQKFSNNIKSVPKTSDFNNKSKTIVIGLERIEHVWFFICTTLNNES